MSATPSAENGTCTDGARAGEPGSLGGMVAAVFIHEHSVAVTDRFGVVYRARVYGEERPDGRWTGWIEFMPDGTAPLQPGRRCRTGQETSQPDREALDYWAGGLEPVYLDGALARALRRTE